MAYIDVYTTAKEEQFLQRLSVAAAEAARDVFVDGTASAIDKAMVPYAGPRTADWRRFAEEIALLLLFLNPALDGESSDANLLDAVAGLWSVYAQILVAKGLIEVAA